MFCYYVIMFEIVVMLCFVIMSSVVNKRQPTSVIYHLRTVRIRPPRASEPRAFCLCGPSIFTVLH